MQTDMTDDADHAKPLAVVVGGGPAGLMAAEELAKGGCRVVICEAKPSAARKFLMAGKSGLNLTKAEPVEHLLAAYGGRQLELAPMIRAFDAAAVQDWAQALGQDLFVGSTGRVFPTVMKASPLLRAWLARLNQLGVELRTRWRWMGWDNGALTFDTEQGRQHLSPMVTVLALGGASWSRLGSDSLWADILHAKGVSVSPFLPANAGIVVPWTAHMTPHFGAPIKGVAFRAGTQFSRGEAIISERGLEGGGIYAVCAAVRDGAELHIDLLPDLVIADVADRLARSRGRASLSNHLRKVLKLGPVRLALMQEFGRPLPQDPAKLAKVLKSLPVRHSGLRPIDEAISTAGGIAWSELDSGLMLKQIPGVFAVGEMLDWEAPTGGYLLTACFATGRWAGRAAAARACAGRPSWPAPSPV